MFRRKKSTQDATRQPISISSPMRMAPQSHIGQSSSPLYEKFTKTATRPNGEGIPSDPIESQYLSSTQASTDDVLHSVIRDRRMSSRVGLGISPNSNGISNLSKPKQEFSTTVHESQLNTSQSPTKPEKDTKFLQNSSGQKPQNRIPTPPSPSSKPSRLLPTVTIPGYEASPTNMKHRSALSSPAPWTSSTRSPSSSAFTYSNQTTPSPVTPITPQTPQADESGHLSPEIKRLDEPSLGNSLETRRAPRRGKYSPLAAFGPGPSPSSLTRPTNVSGSLGKSMDTTSTQETLKPDISPTSHFLSVSEGASSPVTHARNTVQNIQSHDANQSSKLRTSEDTQGSFDDKHASVQPLKTASVELRVKYDAEEQAFRSPLFAATSSSNKDPGHSSFEAEGEMRGRQRISVRNSLYYNYKAEGDLKNEMVNAGHNLYAPMLNSTLIDHTRHDAEDDRNRPMSTLGHERDGNHGSTTREWAGRARTEGWEGMKRGGGEVGVEETEIREDGERTMSRPTIRDQEPALKTRTRSRSGRTRIPTDRTPPSTQGGVLYTPHPTQSSDLHMSSSAVYPSVVSGSNVGSSLFSSRYMRRDIGADGQEAHMHAGPSASLSSMNNNPWQPERRGHEEAPFVPSEENDHPVLQRSHSQKARERVKEREREMERERQRMKSQEGHEYSSENTLESKDQASSFPQTPQKRHLDALNQLPTPPTSIDGHISANSSSIHDSSFSRVHPATIASILEADNDRIGAARERLRMIGSREGSPYDVVGPSASQPPQTLVTDGMQASFVNSITETTRGFVPGMVSPSPISRGPSYSSPVYNAAIRPSVQTVNLSSTMQGTPLSPPQSPPQSRISAGASPISSTSLRSRSKSRTRRPNTGSSIQSTKEVANTKEGYNYKPPSSASSVDGYRSGSLTGSIGRKLQKSSSTRPHVKTLVESPTDMYAGNGVAQINGITSELVDSDPFAKGEIERTDSSSIHSHSSHPSRPNTAQTKEAPPLPISTVSHSHTTSSGTNPNQINNNGSSERRTRREGRLDNHSREVALAQEGNKDDLATENGVQESTDKEQQDVEPEPEKEPTFYPLEKHLLNVSLFGSLLPYLELRDWCALIAVNDALRRNMEHRRELRELILEHFLVTIGYTRWRWDTKEHIMLTFRDLNSYMRGVSIPSHQFSTCAKNWLDARSQAQAAPDDDYLRFKAKSAALQKSLLASSCRAYTRVVLRLRAQAEAMEREYEPENQMNPVYQFTPPQSSTSVNAKLPGRRSASRARNGSRPPSPTTSNSHSAFSHARNGSGGYAMTNRNASRHRFRSPLFQLGHAPVLRVFVVNPEGTWLSDENVIECEKELKRAGVLPLVRTGDVVWDTAIGDEGNMGRLIWDGNYLIDLDYTYSRTGEIPQYLHTLSFPPSYFHRVIRTSGNPICYIDISPWAEEIAANLQLLQDRVKAETPQGGRHMVVRWVHRSKFHIRPNPFTNAPMPIPDTSLSVDPGWFGSIIIETEGTNEGLADLQARCKRGFPPRAVGTEVHAVNGNVNGSVNKKPPGRVYRLLRERSRPGEIWLRAVREKERLL